ncbi:hypothetical protein HZU72_15940 [Halomonas sp. QX-2]|jgi:hypothetical protein|uniref:Uncharacterized protein n=1 Tax=Vreelandella sedimenti TaxID=2729618 RepID=A0A7Z0N916_9GAMM|nr:MULTISPECIES: hypothetical protein [Halomonas]NYT73905.1 hypothetical protein [Halomonas sedimenti]|tara:strand:- start:20439 stop:20615 length:177 start_codon:yes stop_codon:yes gene_type:complete
MATTAAVAAKDSCAIFFDVIDIKDRTYVQPHGKWLMKGLILRGNRQVAFTLNQPVLLL